MNSKITACSFPALLLFAVAVAGSWTVSRLGSTNAQQQAAIGAGTQKQEEPALGVRLIVPSGWLRTDLSTGGVKTVVFSSAQKDLSTRISLLVLPAAALPAGLATREAGMKKALGANYRRARLEAATVLGKAGSVWEYTTVQAPIQRTVEYGLEVGGKFYVIQFSAPEASWAATEPAFATALKSVELFEIPTPPNESATMVPMRDGTRLYTYVVLPREAATEAVKVPALLIRSPYYFEYFDHSLEAFRPFTEQGYALVYQSVRGTGKSEGQVHPMSQEFSDGQDAVRWIAHQTWCNGAVGTIGSSYDGFTALAAAVDTPEVKLVLADGAPIRAFETWPATDEGIVTAQLVWWDRAVNGKKASQEDPGYRRTITNSRPVRELDVATFGEQDPIWRGTLSFMDRHSAFWDDWSLPEKLTRICAPVISMEAKNEFTSDGLDAFLALRAKPCNAQVGAAHRFVIHAGNHGEAIYHPFAATPAGELIRSYMAKYLKRESVTVNAAAVHYSIQNADEWHTADRWPVSDKTNIYYLEARDSQIVGAAGTHPAHVGRLDVSLPSAEGTVSYTFDPALDDACDAKNTERLAFESPKLKAPLDLVGRAELVLFVKIDTPDADLFAQLLDSDLHPVGQGVGMRLRFRHSMAAPEPMHPDEVAELHLLLNAAAFRFRADSSLIVVVKSSTCGLSENPNTGGSMTNETETRSVIVEVLTGPAHPSRLIIPTR